MKTVLTVLSLVVVLMSSGYAQDTVQVKAGWNIIGSAKTGSVPEVLSTFPDSIIITSLFGYTPGAGYQSTDTLWKGLGYWVKVSADGILIFEDSLVSGCGVKRVNYGGISYGTVVIGDQCWLEENLNVGTMVTGVTDQTDNATLEKYCYADEPVNCGAYGGLYQWDEAMQYVTIPGTRGICPVGWHIPTHAEFETLSSTVSGDGNALKKGGAGAGDGLGTNTSGFSGLLAGFRFYDGSGFSNLGLDAGFPSSTEYDATYAYALYMTSSGSNIYLYLNPSKYYGFSVRCLED